jgi:hypothetical protein
MQLGEKTWTLDTRGRSIDLDIFKAGFMVREKSRRAVAPVASVIWTVRWVVPSATSSGTPEIFPF